MSNPYVPAERVLVDGARFKVEVDDRGKIWNGYWLDRGGVASAGLWIAREQGGEVSASVAWVRSPAFSNVRARLGDHATGVYYITADSLGRGGNGWPSDLGAPTGPHGDAELMGDVMAWQALFPWPDSTAPELSRPIEGLRVEQTVFAHREQEWKDVFFVHYRLTNTTDRALTGLHVGFHTDTDIGDDYEVCGNAGENATGYDASEAVSYTYPFPARSNRDCGPLVTGYSFLSTPHDGPVPSAVLSHRIVRKNDYVNPAFGEFGIVEPRQFLLALKGLSNAGEPMVNPATDETSLFAFDGSPITGEGWLDTPIDVRSLLSLKPFDIPAGGSAELTVAFAASKAASLSQAIPMTVGQIAQLRENKAVWSR